MGRANQTPQGCTWINSGTFSFFRLIKITLKNRDYDKLKEGSFWLYNVFSQHLSIPVLGPEEPAISRVRSEYIRNILIYSFMMLSIEELDHYSEALEEIENTIFHNYLHLDIDLYRIN